MLLLEGNMIKKDYCFIRKKNIIINKGILF